MVAELCPVRENRLDGTTRCTEAQGAAAGRSDGTAAAELPACTDDHARGRGGRGTDRWFACSVPPPVYSYPRTDAPYPGGIDIARGGGCARGAGADACAGGGRGGCVALRRPYDSP